jgi:hypothetical protein
VGEREGALENMVKYRTSSKDFLEVADIIQHFLDGTGDQWAWDNFISGRRFKDRDLEEVRRQCDSMSAWHPATKPGYYCNDDGLFLLKSIADDLRKRAAATEQDQKPPTEVMSSGAESE